MSLAPPLDNRWGCAQWGCAALVALALLVLFAPVFYGGRSPEYGASCQANLKQLAYGLQMYVQDYDEHLPPAGKWHDASFPYTRNESLYVCYKRAQQGTSYAFNALLDGRSTRQPDPAQVPLLFESRLGQRNGADTLQSFVAPHNGRGNVAFLDAHVKRVAAAPAANAGLRVSEPR